MSNICPSLARVWTPKVDIGNCRTTGIKYLDLCRFEICLCYPGYKRNPSFESLSWKVGDTSNWVKNQRNKLEISKPKLGSSFGFTGKVHLVCVLCSCNQIYFINTNSKKKCISSTWKEVRIKKFKIYEILILFSCFLAMWFFRPRLPCFVLNVQYWQYNAIICRSLTCAFRLNRVFDSNSQSLHL